MSKKLSSNEAPLSKRNEQAKRDIDILKAELQQLIDNGRNRPRPVCDGSLLNKRLPDKHKNLVNLNSEACVDTNQERKPIQKTDLLPTSVKSTKSLPISVKSPKEKSKAYNVEEAREYMRKQKEKRVHSLKRDLKSSEHNVEERKQKLKELHEKTRRLLSKNVQRSRSRSKSKDKNSNSDLSPNNKQSQHISRKLSNSEVFHIKPDVISNLPSTSANHGSTSSKESLFKNVTNRDKSPRSLTTSESSTPLVVVSEGIDINKAAIMIQAAFKGFKQRKRFKQIVLEKNISANKRVIIEKEQKEVPKWLQTKLSSAPYNVAKTFKRKLAFAAYIPSIVQETTVDIAVQSSESLLENISQSRDEIKQVLKDSVKNSKHKDLKSFLSHKCLDLDLKKVEELNLISAKQKSLLADSDSDTSKNIPDLSVESKSTLDESNDYCLDINSKRLKELKLRSKNISLNSNQQLNRTLEPASYKLQRNIEINRIDSKRLEPFEGKENSNNLIKSDSNYSSRSTSRKDSSYVPTAKKNVFKSIELDSSQDNKRNLFNPDRVKEMLLLTALNEHLDESELIEHAEISENALSLFKNTTQSHTIVTEEPQSYYAEDEMSRQNEVTKSSSKINDKLKKNKNQDQSLSNSELELEICENLSKNQSANDFSTINTKMSVKSKNSSRIDDFLNLVSQRDSIVIDSIFSTTFESDISTEKPNKLMSSTAKNEKVLASKKRKSKQEEFLPVKSGDIITTTAQSNQINVRFQAEIHLLNDFNQSLSNLQGIEKSLNNLHVQNQNPKTVYQNQDTQTSFISSNKSTNSPIKISGDNQTDASANILNTSAVSSADCSLLNGSIFEKFEKISSAIKEENILNDTASSKMGENSFVEGENNMSFKVTTKPISISQEALSLQHFEQLIKDEEARRDYLKTIFEIRKDILLDRAKVELSMLEIQKKHLVETGQLNEASAVRKKQRGILIKLQHEKYEMQRLMQMQKAASKERKNILKEQQNVIKAQLTLNDGSIVSKIKKNHHLDRRSSGPLKVFAPHHHRLSSNHRRSDSSVTSRHSSSIAEELIVTTSYHSDSGASVTSVTQETSKRTTTVTTELKKDDSQEQSESLIITEINDDNEENINLSVAKDQSVQENETQSKSLESVNIVSDRDGRKSDCENALINTGQLDYFAMERVGTVSMLESQIENNKRLLLMKEDALQRRRRAAEELLDWHQRLLEEEKKVSELEMAATSIIAHLPMQNKPTTFIPIRNSNTEIATYQPPQINILWPNKMTGKESKDSTSENAIFTTKSDKVNEDNVINNTRTNSLNNDVPSDCDNNENSTSIQQELNKIVSKHSICSSDSYSCEFDPGETTEDEISLKTVKSSEIDEDVNILKSQSTLNDIMHNITIISEELSEIYRISSGNNNLNIDESGQLVESQSNSKLVQIDDESGKNDTFSVPTNFNLEEAEILEQNIKLIEMEIEELQSKTLTADKFSEDTNQNKSNLIQLDISDQNISNLIDLDGTINGKDEIIDDNAEETTISNNLATDSQIKTTKTDEELVTTEEKVSEIVELDDDSVSTPQSFELEESIPESSEILSSKAPDIIESLNRNTEENIDSHSSSKMPEILENLNVAAQQTSSSKTTSPSHSSEPSLEEPLMKENDEFSEDFDEVSIDLPSSELGIAIANDDIMNTVRMCTQNSLKDTKQLEIENNESTEFDVLDESSIINHNKTLNSVENNLDKTYVVHKPKITTKIENLSDETIIEQISHGCSWQEETPNLLDISLLNDSNKENETPKPKEIERLPSIFGGGQATIFPRENVDDLNDSNGNISSNDSSSSSNGVSSKTDGVLNVKKRVSEILADAKQKTDKSTRIQDLYTTTYDVSFTEKASEIVSELDQLDPELISPKLVEVKAEELELLKKQWAIEQEIKQLEEQQLSEQREQLPYQYLREIPNKPPPPYTPPINQVPLVTIPSVIPSNVTQLSNVLSLISDYLYNCYANKTLQSSSFPEETLAELNTPEINELIFDLCKELTEAHYDQFRMTDDDYTPSWMRSEETIASLKKPLDKEGLCKFLEEKCADLYGFKEKVNVKESSTIKWSRKKRDHVDEVLVRELQADECNWINYEQDELIVTDKLVEDVTDILLKEILDELKDWWTAKNT